VYEQGGGRLDIGHAVDQRLIARRANIDYGYFRYPQTDVQPVTKALPLLNLGSAAATVDLRVELESEDGDPAPAGMLSVTPSQLTLAPGAEASAQVTVDVQAGPPGLYSGAVIATQAGGPAVRVPIGFYKEPERYNLTLKAIGRDGKPATYADAGVMNVDDGELFADFVFFDETGSATVRVAPGRYHIMGFVVGGSFDTFSMVGDPERRVSGDTTFTLDARRAKPVRVGIRGVDTDAGSADLGYTRLDQGGDYGLAMGFGVGGAAAETGLYAEPTDPVRVGQFEVELRIRLLPAGTSSPATASTLYDLLLFGGRVPDPPSWVVDGTSELARVTGRYRSLNDNAEYQDVRIGFAPLQFFAGGSYESIAVPRTRYEYVSPAPIQWFHDAIWYRGEAFIDFLGPWPDPYQPGQRTEERWFWAPLHAYGYGDRSATSMFVGAADLRDTGGHNGYPWSWSDDPAFDQWFRLYRNGQLVGRARDPFLQVSVPATRAQYRLERDLNLTGVTGPGHHLADPLVVHVRLPGRRGSLRRAADPGRRLPGHPPGRPQRRRGRPPGDHRPPHRPPGGRPSQRGGGGHPAALAERRSHLEGARARAGRGGPLPRRAPRVTPARRHLGQPAHHGPRRHQQPGGAGAHPGVPGPVGQAAGQGSIRSRPLLAAPARSASSPKASTGPRAPVPSRPVAAARVAPQARRRAVRV